jgi:hypothetical protein
MDARAVPGRRERRNLLVAGQLLADAVIAVSGRDRHDGDRERGDDTDSRCQPEAKRLHLPSCEDCLSLTCTYPGGA